MPGTAFGLNVVQEGPPLSTMAAFPFPVTSANAVAPQGSSSGHHAAIPGGGVTQFELQPPGGAMTVKFKTQEAVFEAQS
jgi:hypothetical protein